MNNIFDVHHCTLDSFKILKCYHDYGFYSTSVETFSAILFSLNSGIIPENISYKNCCNLYKLDSEQDIFPEIFFIDKNNIDIPLNENIFIPHCNTANHSLNKDNIKKYNKIVKKYFNPSKSVIDFKNYLIKKYNINFDQTIAILYRGTDKKTEVNIASPDEYLKVCEKILKDHPNFKVLIQSDQTQVINYFKTKLGDKCFNFEEIESTESNVGIHYFLKSISSDPTESIKRFDAAVRCIANCNYFICNTGNIPLFAKFYRGNLNNVYTFDENGKLIF